MERVNVKRKKRDAMLATNIQKKKRNEAIINCSNKLFYAFLEMENELRTARCMSVCSHLCLDSRKTRRRR